MAVKPGNEAIEAVKKVAPKGADVVLEMVGHNQDTCLVEDESSRLGVTMVFLRKMEF